MNNKSQSSPPSSPQIDLSVFNNIDNQQTSAASSSCPDFKACPATKRLLVTLKYYSSLDLKSNPDHANIFAQFIHEIYSTDLIIMDYFHLQKKHGQEIYDIMNHSLNHHQFKPCNLDDCQYSSRLYRVSEAAAIVNKADNDYDPSIKLVGDILDGIHHYVFHLFQSGFRSIDVDYDDNKTEAANAAAMDEYFDGKFALMSKRINDTKAKTRRFNRISGSNKFSLNIIGGNKKPDNDIHDDDDNDGITYLDTIYDNLLASGIETEIISKLADYILNESYDTESLDLDFKLNGDDGGNISLYIANKDCTNCIREMIQESTLTSGAFSVGFNFQYWKHKKYIIYKNGKQELNDFYVDNKYDNLKEEILNYRYLNIALYFTEIMPKSTAFHQSKLVQSLKCNDKWGDEHYEDKYGISSGDVISQEMLICIILYTDYTDLSTDFSSTFRKNNPFQPLQAVKRRNRCYYWMAKGLKETIHIYGQDWYDGKGLLSKLTGPFFCGISFVMNMPAFNIRLNGPTSTSIEKEVATNFCGEEGIIIQFDNTNFICRITPAFDVSFISRYGGQENERLFFGEGDGIFVPPLGISTIIIQETRSNLRKIIKPITILDMIISWNVNDDSKIGNNPDDVSTLKSLFAYYLYPESQKEFKPNQYIFNTFLCFLNNKDSIMVDLDKLDEHCPNKGILSLIFTQIIKDTDNDAVLTMNEDNDKNLVKKEVFTLFKNVTDLFITCDSYSISLLALLSIINNTKINNIKIYGDNWLPSIVSSSAFNGIVAEYKKANFTFELKKDNKRLVITKHSE